MSDYVSMSYSMHVSVLFALSLLSSPIIVTKLYWTSLQLMLTVTVKRMVSIYTWMWIVIVIIQIMCVWYTTNHVLGT